MSDTLFREEVIQHRRRIYGDVILTPPFSAQVGALVLLLLLAMIGLVLAFGQFARHEKVEGYLSPTTGVVKIHAPQPGVIAHAAVTEGMLVARGDVLFTIEGKRYLTGGAHDTGEEMVQALIRERALLEARIVWQSELMEARQLHHQEMTERMEAEVSSLEGQMVHQRAILALARKDRETSRILSSKGYETRINLRHVEQQMITHEKHLKELETLHSSKKLNLARNAFEARQSPILIQDQIHQLKSSMEEIGQRIIEMQMRQSIEVHAPVGGRVSFLQITPGTVINQNIPLLSIIPENAELVAELYVPSRAIAFVKTGQEVRIQYDSFPYQKFGSFSGHITEVADSVLNRNEILGPVKGDEPHYRVRVALDQQYVSAYGETHRLHPGSSLSADIILDRRAIYEWALDPFYSLKGRMF